jgi:hypothetical protein
MSKPQYQWSPGLGRYVRVMLYEKPQRPTIKVILRRGPPWRLARDRRVLSDPWS